MIEHLVLMQFKPDTPEEQKVTIQNELRNLKGKIDSIIDLSVGKNFSDRSQGYEIGLTVRFQDKAGLEVYAKHPDHVAVVEGHIKPAVSSVIAVDYEF